MFNIDVTESDRGVVILAVANIEDLLDKVLRLIVESSELPKKKYKSIFDTTGALGNFSAKYHSLVVFGYISKESFDDLEKLRKIRNQFAHTSADVKFHNPQILNILKSMLCFQESSRLMNIQLGLPSNTVLPFDEPIEEHEALSKGLIKRAKADFGIAIALLGDNILKDMNNRLVINKN